MSKETQLLVFYDISDDKARQKLHRKLQDYGLNSQKSLFEIQCSHSNRKEIQRFLASQEPAGQEESILVYEICRRCLAKTKTLGNSPGIEFKNYQLV